MPRSARSVKRPTPLRMQFEEPFDRTQPLDDAFRVVEPVDPQPDQMRVVDAEAAPDPRARRRDRLRCGVDDRPGDRDRVTLDLRQVATV